MFTLHYARLQTSLVFITDSLNKREKFIAENEELFTSYANQEQMMKCYLIIESKRKEIERTGYKHTAVKLPMQL